ncbi:adenosylcobalamin-dependent ribonucleoside-diphosphate reductase [Peloplasma aerotolerans]|uniref:Vitamin B12-dependent ribonucleotide reductase n=1 Tax=Peloplasma aerotolerans TaxID=3044389 RepID=A0AAW6UCT8_9MOLU|nr:adenosylcobalamin-dependent ribonucleoside-diphosphate reductase [Mariniplasma sp. M4Ah]MDI6452788.1 adenosylcobalamin-dependent ribonucleoside-diphosphate reductase [Mariniplasma sp. M4Ah]MDR4968039.1 adenosylcobalamin-dependent ribonucleoside-diphosphate reductase [Acholeplasmataceae bacterium]
MYVVKRNGAQEPFDLNKIANAMQKAYKSVGIVFSDEDCLKQATEITKAYSKNQEVSIETIQDDVELYLMKKKHYEAAKSYIKYREKQKTDRDNPWADNDERQDLILNKYLIPGEGKKEFLKRIAFGRSALEKILRRKEAIFGGRNLYAIGRDGNITGSNCYVTQDPEDSLESIYKVDYQIARTYSYGGGQGMNLSKIRPKGAKVNNSSNTTPGVMVFAEKYSHTTLNTQQDNRRGALMLVLNIDHPDIIDFITTKLDLSKVNGANISIAITDEFMEAARNDEVWVMRFETPYEKIEKKIKARDLLKLVGYSAHTMGDPGVIFIDHMNGYHFLSEYDDVKFTATNPCGEQPLMPHGSCNLGSINLNAFIKNPFTENATYDWDRFDFVVTEMIYSLDDLLTMLGDRHALPEQREHVKLYREVGLGVMGLADVALSMRLPYGSKEFIEFLDQLMRRMLNTAAKASALRAKELGTFPRFDYEKVSKSKFYQTGIDKDTDELIKQYGLRNSRLLSIAPTGSISNILGVSGGVEPFFQINYTRRIVSMFEEEKTITIWEKTPLALAKAMGISPAELPDWALITSQNIDFMERAEVQATIQKYVDTAISSTFNLPNSASVADVMSIYQTAWEKGFKGATVFRDRCAKIGILAGINENTEDLNPATPPTVHLEEKWTDKKTNTVKEYITHIAVSQNGHTPEKIEKELCPLCGDVLVKKQGCIQCNNNDCDYEKCAI